jgi:Conserved TM helix
MNQFDQLLNINNWWSSQLLQSVVDFLPKLLFALFVWIVFWFVAKAVRAWVLFVAEKIGLEKLTEKTWIGKFLTNANFKQPISVVIAALFYWIVYLIWLNIAFDTMGLTTVSTLISDLISYIPNLFIAVILIVIGSYAAKFVKDITDGALATAEVEHKWVGHVGYIVVMVFAIITALKQAKIDISFLTDNLNTIVMGIMLALGLAFGLGWKDKAKEVIEKYMK